MEVWGGNVETNRALEMPGLRVWISSNAYGSAEQGGDVYYISACASGRITRFLLADISGHGQEVAQTAVRLRDLMRKNVNVVKQRRLVQAMNEQFASVTADGRFATALVCTYFQPTHSFQWSNAGHPPPFLFRHKEQAWSILQSKESDAGDIPLGIDESTGFSVSKVKLQPGDLVVCYSDAFNESLSPQGSVIGVRGLFDVVSHLNQPPDKLIAAIETELKKLNEDNLSTDDATMAVLQAVPGRTSLKDNLLAALRVLRPANDATRFRTSPPPAE